jgi:hypothetical protein
MGEIHFSPPRLSRSISSAPMRASIVGPPFVATRIKASIAACHSGASWPAFGSLPASSSVTSSRPRGRGIGSSNARFQPRSGTSPPFLRHAFAAIEAPIFLGSPVPVVLPRLKIRLRPVRQKHAPCRLKIDPRLVERSRGAGRVFPRVRAGIETTVPLPWSVLAGLPVRVAIMPTRTSP